MKLTTATLRKLIKEELNNVLNEDSSDQLYDLMIRHNDYGVVGSVSQSPVDYGRYTMNNGGSAFTDYENVNQFLVSYHLTIHLMI